MELYVSRRSILKSAGAFASTAALGSGGLLSLNTFLPSEAHAMQTSAGDYQIRTTACTMCPAECGMEMWIKNGQVAKIYGNKAVPMNDGACCAKGAAGQQLIYSPFRLKQPMIRVGERGEGKWLHAV